MVDPNTQNWTGSEAEQVLARPTAARDGDIPIRLRERLPPDASDSFVADAMCDDLELRLESLRPARAAEYLAVFPRIAADDQLVRYILEAEILARKKYGPAPAAEEYAGRYPAIWPYLEKLFAGDASPSLHGFTLGGEIGQGGMGVVYRARDIAFGRDVAIKLLRDKFAPGSPAATRFLEEARITGQLQHPGIPAVSTFARPQSITCTSPNAPTMMLEGFRSRWMTSRECA